MAVMGHGEAMLAAVSANLQREEAERVKQAILRQNMVEVPALFQGFIRATNADKGFQMAGHTPLLEDLPPTLFKYQEAAPVNATIFNPAAFAGIPPAQTATSAAVGTIQRINDVLFEDLLKLGVNFTMEADVSKRPEGDRYYNYTAVATFITGGTKQEPYLVKDTKSLGTFLSYLMTKEIDGRPLVTPREVMDLHGYGFLMEIAKPANIEALNGMGLNFEGALQKAGVYDHETVSRIATYRMDAGQMTAQDVHEKYGGHILLKATSEENITWLKGLTGKPTCSLEDALPEAAAYLKTMFPPTRQEKPAAEPLTGKEKGTSLV